MKKVKKKEILEHLEKRQKRRKIIYSSAIFVLIIALLILGIIFYNYSKSPEKTIGLGANIEQILLSPDGKNVYVKLAGGSLDKNITKIKFIFKDEAGKESVYSTTDGINEIEVPYSQSFLDWLLGKELKGVYDYNINSSVLGLDNLGIINNVEVLFEYATESGKTIESPVLNTGVTTTPKITTPARSGGGGGGGGGEIVLPVILPCVSNITNTTWASWVNQGSCRIDDKQIQNRTSTEYDSNNCGFVNNTYWDYQNVSCNYCSYNPQNTSWTNWINISCLSSNTMNQSRTKIEYDVNYHSCYAITNLASDLWNSGNNKTYIEYRNTTNCQFSCVPTLTCSINYPGQCGINLFNGCNNVLNCANNCQGAQVCYAGFCQESCSNDLGCSSAGDFCDENTPYSCTLNSSSGCFYRTNKTSCIDSCINGNCFGTVEINSCTNIDSSGNYFLTQNILNNSLTQACIKINSENVVLDCQENSISSLDAVTGIYSNQKNTTIKNCNISMGVDSPGFGIEIENTSGAIVQNNILSLQYTGVYLHNNVTDSLIEGNYFVRNNNKAVHISLSSENIIGNNIFENNTFYGIILTKSFNNLIENNILKGNSLGAMWYGVLIEASLDANPDGNNQIINNQIIDSRTGVYVKTSGNTLKNNFINNSLQYHGLYVFGGNNSVIINNTLNNNKQFGLRIRNSNNNTVKNNTALFNSQQSLEISGTSSSNNLENNLFCSSAIQDISCEINQMFNGNYCGSGSVCGGVCTSCPEFSQLSVIGITGNVVSDNSLNKNNFFLVLSIFSIIIIGLVLIRKIRLGRKNRKLTRN